MTKSLPADSAPPEFVLREIERLAREKLDWSGELAPEMRLVEDLELDSLRSLTLAIEIENHFRIVLDEEDEEELTTVGDLVATIAAKLAAQASTSGDAGKEE